MAFVPPSGPQVGVGRSYARAGHAEPSPVALGQTFSFGREARDPIERLHPAKRRDSRPPMGCGGRPFTPETVAQSVNGDLNRFWRSTQEPGLGEERLRSALNRTSARRNKALSQESHVGPARVVGEERPRPQSAYKAAFSGRQPDGGGRPGTPSARPPSAYLSHVQRAHNKAVGQSSSVRLAPW
mmetsp:Transcript_11501/g.40000  ORF Transcript_11501/g.40000 Transcript_11501/m.40000 type:complete len:184 (-) Transcript_11501:1853-2404(-)